MTYEQTAATHKALERAERRDVLKRTCFVGATLLCDFAMMIFLSLVVAPFITRAEAAIEVSVFHRLWYYVLYGVFYCTLVVAPVLLPALLFRQKPWLPRGMRRRVSPLEVLLLLLFGLGFCVLANYLTSYWLTFMELFGVLPYEGDLHATGGLLSLLLNVILYAVFPAVMEELVYRGWFLSALQPCGERGALVLSALIFGLAHGNLTQLPFAFLLGLLFGWIYLSTGRLWIGMLLHFLNNGMAVALDFASVYLSESAALALQVAVFSVLTIVGLTAGVLLMLHPAWVKTARPLANHRHPLSSGWRAGLMWGNPGIVLAVVLYFGLTLLTEVVRIWM